jgi:hypothetical protein
VVQNGVAGSLTGRAVNKVAPYERGHTDGGRLQGGAQRGAKARWRQREGPHKVSGYKVSQQRWARGLSQGMTQQRGTSYTPETPKSNDYELQFIPHLAEESFKEDGGGSYQFFCSNTPYGRRRTSRK